MKRIATPILILLFAIVPAQAEQAAPQTYLQRSYRPDIAYMILSRSTGLPHYPKPQADPDSPKPVDLSPVLELTLGGEVRASTARPQPIVSPLKTLDFNILSRLQKFDIYIKRYSQMNDIDPNLTRAMIYVESAGDHQAVSHQGAKGLMQLMPATAADMGVSNPFDPAQNIFGGTRYIQSLVKRFGSIDLALWAYNAGPEAVRRKKRPRETLRYIPKVFRIKQILDQGGV